MRVSDVISGAIFLALAIYLVPKILRGLRTLFRRFFGKDRTAAAGTPPLSAHP